MVLEAGVLQPDFAGCREGFVFELGAPDVEAVELVVDAAGAVGQWVVPLL